MSRFQRRRDAQRHENPWVGTGRVEVGRSLVLTVGDGANGALWEFGGERGVPLVGHADTALKGVDAWAARALGGWRLKHLTACPAARVRFLEGTVASSVDGDSLGAAVLLAIASRGLGVPVPADVVAIAQLVDGELRSVDGMQAKLRALRRHAPRVSRCFVAPDQKVPPATEGLTFLRVSNGLELVNTVFGTGLIDAPDQSSRLLRVVLDGSLRTDWRPIIEHCDRLLHSAVEKGERERLEVVRAIAKRHAGEPQGPLPSLSVEVNHKILRDRLTAQTLQQWADSASGESDLPDLVRVRLPVVFERSASELQVSGAVGRAFAAGRRYREAATILEETVRAWFDVGSPADASRPLCEWVRVASITNADLQSCAEFAHELLAQLLANGDEYGAAYIVQAMSRAFICIGQLDEAARWESQWRDSWHRGQWLHECFERWSLRAKWLRSNATERAQVEHELEAFSREERGASDRTSRLLAAIDAKFLAGDYASAEQAVDQYLKSSHGAEERRLVEGSSGQERARRLVYESRY